MNAIRCLWTTAPIAVVIALCWQAAASAQQPLPHNCERTRAATPILTPPLAGEETVIRAEKGVATGAQEFRLEGNVEIQRGNRRLSADEAVYDKNTDILEASGNVRYDQNGLAITGSHAKVDFDSNQAEVQNARYAIANGNARGQASLVRLQPTIVHLEDATYTTCAPEREAWLLKARALTLDADKASGKARDVTLRLANIPVIYLPYATFPLGERKSGFLVPNFDVSETSGVELTTPYYLNLAPNYDATITPRWLSERGLQMRGEYRYLSRRHRGQADVEYLSSDRRSDSERHLLALKHRTRLTPRWNADLLFAEVSDKNYFRDLGGDFASASQTHLERHLNTTVVGDQWQITGRVQDFQLLDPTADLPYARMPQIIYNRSGVDHMFRYTVQGEFVRFAAGPGDAPNGNRFDFYPKFAFPLRRAFGFVTPRASYRYTYYKLSDGRILNRNVPTVSIDSGLFFDRPTDGGTHTLEPRVFYVYTPFRQQDDLPLFDAGLLQFNFSQLFQENRYAGADRVGDKNQISMALISRVLSENSGRERVRAGIGQIWYFSDQRVALPGENTFKAGDSRVVGELAARLGRRWYSGGEIQWLSGEEDPERGSFRVNYGGKKTAADLSYQFRRDLTNQVGIATLWQVSSRWRLAGRWLYSLTGDRTLDAVVGIEYQSCCWALRTMARHFVNDPEGGTNTSYGLQLELKGLTSVGKSLDQTFDRSILGFIPNP